MARFGAEFSIAGVNATDGVLFNLKAAATGNRPRLIRVFFGVETAPSNAPIFGLKRMNAVGTGTITTATNFLFDAGDNAALSTLETAWVTTRPTVTGGSVTRGSVALAVGNGFLFDFSDSPLIVAVSSGICGVMRNASGATLGVLGGHVIWDE